MDLFLSDTDLRHEKVTSLFLYEQIAVACQ